MIKEGQDRTFAVLRRRLSFWGTRYLDEKTSDINHRDVISDLIGRTELTGSYIASIILANLIALLGLLTNSTAVVIGAMLISPLMGPIFSLGLAFSMGDLSLSRRAVRNIVFSVLLAVVVAALFTLLSPLNEATHEILSRTRPNIYDLLIAFFAGTAGALALCTRKNYLFTTTGVAVATAVIPPLSVVGYGLGTWQLSIAVGGFLLFFTNLVAIVISSNLVFYILRFRGSMVEETHYTIRRRFQILGTVLVVISIPLVITLVTDLQKAKLTGQVESLLKTYLNRQQQSRLTAVTIDNKDGKLVITASINTVKYIGSNSLKEIEKGLTEKVGKAAKLELEQVIVRSGSVDPLAPLRTLTPVAPPQPETLAALREMTIARLGDGCREVEAFIKPYKVSDCSISFSEQNSSTEIVLAIIRDYPPGSQEQLWLKNVLEKQLGVTIELKVATIPFLPAINFTDKDEIDKSSRKAILSLKPVMTQLPASRLLIEIPVTNHHSHPLIKRRADRLKEYLVNEIGIPAGQISVASGNQKMMYIRIQN